MTEEKLLNLLNQAGEEELVALPGVGEALAKRILAARPFESLDDCVERVRGISAATVEKLLAWEAEETSDEAEPVPEETASVPAAADASASFSSDEWKQRLDEMKAQFDDLLESQTEQARERIDALTAELQRKSARQVTWGTLIWTQIITLALALLLFAGVLGIANARLQQDIAAHLDVASQRMDSVQTDVDTLQARVAALEGIGERTTALEEAQSALADSLEETQANMQAVREEMDAVQTALEEQAQRTQRFDDFLQGLQNLLNQALTQPLGGVQ